MHNKWSILLLNGDLQALKVKSRGFFWQLRFLSFAKLYLIVSADYLLSNQMVSKNSNSSPFFFIFSLLIYSFATNSWVTVICQTSSTSCGHITEQCFYRAFTVECRDRQ